ncbi:hypothetical protein LQZ18_14175 [Lachnospiraceae bacterium ZAX-1]
MPFINVRVSTELNDSKQEALKAKIGRAISIIPGKSEDWLMVGIEDKYTLYFKGNQDGAVAFVDVKLYGTATANDYAKMTAELCKIISEELSISADRVFISYQSTENWGWNGTNF